MVDFFRAGDNSFSGGIHHDTSNSNRSDFGTMSAPGPDTRGGS